MSAISNSNDSYMKIFLSEFSYTLGPSQHLPFPLPSLSTTWSVYFVYTQVATANALRAVVCELSWKENSVHKSQRYGVMADKMEINFPRLLPHFSNVHVYTCIFSNVHALIVLIYLIMHDNNDKLLFVCSRFLSFELFFMSRRRETENRLNFKSLLSCCVYGCQRVFCCVLLNGSPQEWNKCS